MGNNMFDLISRWDKMVSMKNLYIANEEKIILTDFRDLVKQTFDVVKKAKNEYIYQKKYPECTDQNLLRYQACTEQRKRLQMHTCRQSHELGW
mgnify:CR=1 FL=1